MTFLPLLLAALLTAPEVRVETLDEGVRKGRITAWQEEGLALQTDDSGQEAATVQVPWDQVLRVDHTVKADRGTAPDAGAFELQLLDSTRVVAADYRIAGDRLVLTGLSGAATSDAKVEVPLSAVHWLRRTVPASEGSNVASRLDGQFSEILQLRPIGDLVVIRKPGGDALNYVEGAIGEVSATKVEFTLDEQVIEVSRDRVFGLVYYRQRSSEDETSPIVVLSTLGRITAESVELTEDRYIVHTKWLDRVELAADQVDAIDFSAGRILYLSDLEPRSIDWSPASLMPLVDPLFGGLVRDRGFYDSQFTLEYPPESLDSSMATSAGVARRVEFRKGLAIRSRSEIAYRLPGGFKQFRATAGIDPKTRATGVVVLRVLGDGRELLRETIVGKQAPHEFQCPVEGVRELRIVVDSGSQDPLLRGTGDNLHLGNARLTK